jgi:hypothetical protein
VEGELEISIQLIVSKGISAVESQEDASNLPKSSRKVLSLLSSISPLLKDRKQVLPGTLPCVDFNNFDAEYSPELGCSRNAIEVSRISPHCKIVKENKHYESSFY